MSFYAFSLNLLLWLHVFISNKLLIKGSALQGYYCLNIFFMVGCLISSLTTVSSNVKIWDLWWLWLVDKQRCFL